MIRKGLLTLAVVLLFSAATMAEEASNTADVYEGFFPVISSYGELDANCPWNEDCSTGTVTGDDYQLGVEFDGTDLWVSSSATVTHGGDNRLLRFNRACQLIDDLTQSTTSTWGWRDLAWDGTYLYGSDENELVKFLPPPIGGPIVKIPLVKPAGINPVRAIAYDPATGHLWTASFRSDIVEFDPVTGASFCVAANNRPIYGMAWDDVCYAALGYANPMLWIHSQGGTPGLTMILFDPVACAYTADSCMGLQPGAIAGGMAFDADNYTPGVGKLLGFNQGTPDMMQAYEVCQTTGVSMSCTNLTPVFCQGKHVYFQVTTTNTTGAPITVTMTFTGYSGNGCVPGNEMVAIPSTKTIPVGVDTKNYFFKVPNAAGPGPYSAKISFTHAGTTYECCMNFTCVACNPWRVGDNTEWAWGEVDRPEIGLPTTTALAQNYPNPFNAETNIGYLLAEAGNVNLSVYDISGRLVETLLDGYQEAGEHIVTWNGSNVSSGVYFYKVTTSDYTATKMMNLLK